jgi:hypothetical protein
VICSFLTQTTPQTKLTMRADQDQTHAASRRSGEASSNHLSWLVSKLKSSTDSSLQEKAAALQGLAKTIQDSIDESTLQQQAAALEHVQQDQARNSLVRAKAAARRKTKEAAVQQVLDSIFGRTQATTTAAPTSSPDVLPKQPCSTQLRTNAFGSAAARTKLASMQDATKQRQLSTGHAASSVQGTTRNEQISTAQAGAPISTQEAVAGRLTNKHRAEPSTATCTAVQDTASFEHRLKPAVSSPTAALQENTVISCPSTSDATPGAPAQPSTTVLQDTAANSSNSPQGPECLAVPEADLQETAAASGRQGPQQDCSSVHAAPTTEVLLAAALRPPAEANQTFEAASPSSATRRQAADSSPKLLGRPASRGRSRPTTPTSPHACAAAQANAYKPVSESDVTLVQLLHTNDQEVQMLAAAALCQLAFYDVKHQATFQAVPGCITRLVELLSSSSDRVQWAAAAALAGIAHSNPHYIKTTIQEPGCAAALVAMMHSSHAHVQQAAGRAASILLNDSGHHYTSRVLESQPGCFAGLLKMSTSCDARIRKEAEGALAKLHFGANSQPVPVSVILGAFSSVEQMISIDDPAAQAVAAALCSRLAYLDQPNAAAVVASPACLALSRLLHSRYYAIQATAAEMLAALAGVSNESQATIVATPGCVEALVQQLRSWDPTCQVPMHAARALGKLAAGDPVLQCIATVDGCLAGLCSLLGSSDAHVQAEAVRAVCILAKNNHANVKAFQAEPGCAPTLQRLAKAEHHLVRGYAKQACHYLSRAHELQLLWKVKMQPCRAELAACRRKLQPMTQPFSRGMQAVKESYQAAADAVERARVGSFLVMPLRAALLPVTLSVAAPLVATAKVSGACVPQVVGCKTCSCVCWSGVTLLHSGDPGTA